LILYIIIKPNLCNLIKSLKNDGTKNTKKDI